MGNAQDPSAAPGPYMPPAEQQNWATPAAPINTPGLDVPVAPVGPPAPDYWQNIASTNAQPAPAPAAPPAPMALASTQPAPDAPPAPGNLAQSYQLTAPGQATPGAAPQGYVMPGQGAAGEARARGQRDAAENERLSKGAESAVNQEKMAQNAVSRVQQNQAADLAINAADDRAKVAEINAKGAQGQQAYDQKLAQRQTDFDNAVSAQKDMVFDPDKYVNSMSVGKKIFTAIAVGLSAIGSSRSIGGSGDNIALKMLNESIQHGVDQQKEAYRRAGVNIDTASNAYARAREAKMDDHQATLAARQASIDEHVMAAKTITARYDPDRIDANRQQMLAHLDTQSAQAKQEFAKSAHAEAARAQSDVLNAQQAGVNMAVSGERLRLDEQNQQWQHEDRQTAASERYQEKLLKSQGKGPGGIADWNGSGATMEQQNKAAGVKGAYDAIAPLMQKALDFRKEHNHGAIGQGAVGQAEALHESTLLEVKNLAQLGVLSDSDIKLVNNLIGPSADSLGGDDKYNARMKEAMSYIKNKALAQMRSYGYTPTSQSDPLQRKADPMTADPGFKEAEGGR